MWTTSSQPRLVSLFCLCVGTLIHESDMHLVGVTGVERQDRCSHARSLPNTDFCYNGKFHSMLFHLNIPPEKMSTLPIGHHVSPSCSPHQLITILTASFQQRSNSTTTALPTFNNTTWYTSLSTSDRDIIQQLCTTISSRVNNDGIGYMTNNRDHVYNCTTITYNHTSMDQQII